MRKYIFLIFIILLAFFSLLIYFLLKPSFPEVSILNTAALNNLIKEKPATKEEKITLIMTGDIMLDRGVEDMIEKEGNNDFRFPFLKIAEDLIDADLLIGNLENPISDKGISVGGDHSFCADPKSLEGLTYAGFDVLSLANNHPFNYGRAAFEDTLIRLKGAGIDYSGAGFNQKEAFSPIIKEVKGIKIAFLSYTNFCWGNWRAKETLSGISCIKEDDLQNLKRDWQKIKEENDLLIINLHSGYEFQPWPNNFQKSFARAAIDSGADLVVGHHPHVVQAQEEYKNKMIFYSLGNFVFDEDFSEETMIGQILKITIAKSQSEIKIEEILPLKIKINSFFQPEIISS